MYKRKTHVRLHDIDKSHQILEEIRDRLYASGRTHALFEKHDSDRLIEFDIMSGLSVYDHGSPQKEVKCIACPIHPELQYEFIIEDLTGQLHGPIGSVCILKRSLGEVDAQRYGKRIQKVAKNFFQPKPIHVPLLRPELSQHEKYHKELRESEGSARGYLKALNMEWLSLAQIAGDKYVILDTEERKVVSSILDSKRTFSEKEFKSFTELNNRRNHVIQSGETIISLSLQENRFVPLKKYKIASDASDIVAKPKRPAKEIYDAFRIAVNLSPLDEEEWVLYLEYLKDNYSIRDITILCDYMSEANSNRVLKKHIDKVPFNSSDITQLIRASHNRAKAVPLKRDSRLSDEGAKNLTHKLVHKYLNQSKYSKEFKTYNQIHKPKRWLEKYFLHIIQEVRDYDISDLAKYRMDEIIRLLKKRQVELDSKK